MLLPFRCPEHKEPSGDVHHRESPAAPGDVCRQGGRSSGALLQADPHRF